MKIGIEWDKWGVLRRSSNRECWPKFASSR